MTSDDDLTTDELFQTVQELWLATQEGRDAETVAADEVPGVSDEAIAEATGLDLAAVRDYLDNADAVQYAVARDGDTRLVAGILGE